MRRDLRIVGGAGKPARRSYVVAGIASMMGTTIEWYDFFLYGTAAALIFNKIFFPSVDPISGTLARSRPTRSDSSRALWAVSSSVISELGSEGNRCYWSRS